VRVPHGCGYDSVADTVTRALSRPPRSGWRLAAACCPRSATALQVVAASGLVPQLASSGELNATVVIGT
jgi:hypothetical protein